MDSELNFGQIKILFLNIFFVMYKAATLNLNKLDQNLHEVNCRLQFNDRFISAYALRFVITLYLLINFIVGYCGMAANVVSIFPILTEELPELLLPTLMLQLVENVCLTIIELILGYITVKYFYTDCTHLLAPLILKTATKTIIGLSVLNIYTDFFVQLNVKPITNAAPNADSDETLIKSEDLT